MSWMLLRLIDVSFYLGLGHGGFKPLVVVRYGCPTLSMSQSEGKNDCFIQSEEKAKCK